MLICECQSQVWCNQSSVSHGSYYTGSLPSPATLGYTDQETAPSHTAHSDGSPLSAQHLGTVFLSPHWPTQDPRFMV